MNLLNILNNKETKKLPIWIMRQAGRYLPEFRKLKKESKGIMNMVYNPKIASDITLQPIKRFGFDAAIIFSDILIIPDALGQKLSYQEAFNREEFSIADNFIKQNESVFPRGLYNTDPCFEIKKGGIQVGFDSLFTKLKDAHESGCNVFLFEGYNGVDWEQINTNTNNNDNNNNAIMPIMIAIIIITIVTIITRTAEDKHNNIDTKHHKKQNKRQILRNNIKGG